MNTTTTDTATDDRRCTTCGQSVEDLPYELWLFHACRHCAYEAARTPDRWGLAGTARKWKYQPRWHQTRHPDRPEWIRQRFADETA